MSSLEIEIVDEVDAIAFLQAKGGSPGQFRAFNDACNELSIRFVPALRMRAAPVWCLPHLRNRLTTLGIAFELAREPDELISLDHAHVVMRRHSETRVHVFLAGKRIGPELFAKYRGILSNADVPYSPGWAAYAANHSGETLVDLCARFLNLDFELDVDDELRSVIRAEMRAREEAVAHTERLGETLHERGRDLYPFQMRGVRWLAQRRQSLLADEMGLGKTAQALLAVPEHAPLLVVCPAVAKGVWRVEAAKWRPDLRVEVLAGRNSFRWPEAGELVVGNYEILSDTTPEGCPENTVLVADEAHALKNPKAKRTMRFGNVAAVVSGTGGRTWLLTGTPLLNQPKELWTLLSQAQLHTRAFGSWHRFMKLFGAEYTEVTKGVWSVQWGEPAPEVQTCLQRVMLRRTREQVLSDLPSKRYQTIPVDDISPGTRKMCAAAEHALATLGISLDVADEDLLIALQKRLNAALGKVSSARKALSIEKGRLALAIVEEHEEQDTPLVVFSAFRPVIDALGERDGWAAITGDTPAAARVEIQESFQAGELRGVAATIRAGGTALTLTRASRALFVDLEWTPGVNTQAEDRLCRIGQTRGVLITQLVADVAIDHRVMAALTRKSKLLEATGLAPDAALSARGDEPHASEG